MTWSHVSKIAGSAEMNSNNKTPQILHNNEEKESISFPPDRLIDTVRMRNILIQKVTNLTLKS